MFLTIAHAATLYYHVHILLAMANTDYTGITDKMVLNYRDTWTKFFTMWCFITQAVLFLLCLVHDVTRLLHAKHPVRGAASWLRDLIFTSIAAPVALNVCFMFWTLFLIDRDLVMPSRMDVVIPTWMNHALHTNIVVLALVELLAEKHQLPALRPSLLLNVTFCVTYLYTYVDVYMTKGFWLYPFFDLLSWPARVVFLLGVLMLAVGQQMAVRAAVQAVWGRERELDRGARRLLHTKIHKD